VTVAPVGRRFSGFLYRHERVRLVGLLSTPMLWLVVLYLGSLAVMVVSSFWSVDSFTGALVEHPTGDNYRTLFSADIYRTVALRTLGVAVAVTLIDLVIGLPIAFVLGKMVRSRRVRHLLVVLVTMPLWASYLVKGYAWRIMLDRGGVVDWVLGPFGLHGPGLGLTATIIALAYLWLPFMILPIYAGLERLPDSLLEASADLGGTAGRTFRRVVLPLVLPAIAAGSIFSFSLTLGDYIMVQIVGGDTQLFANIIYANVGVAGNLPFAAAATMFPIVVVLLYLAAVRRTGALESL
jgi:putative spermidine/putrescine transport system permease protein